MDNNQYENIELGNLMFGNSRGDYIFPNRELVNCWQWRRLWESVIGKNDCYGYTNHEKYENKSGGYTDRVLEINPYYWGDNEEDAEKHNFIYKPNGFWIDWYKYPFRDSYMSNDLSEEQLKSLWDKLYYEVECNKT